MFNGIYSSASAMEIGSLGHQVISNNLANVATPGFRRTLLAVSARQGNLDTGFRGARPAATHIDFSQGRLEQTERTLDVAINGDGFFVVETPDGTRYTRNGSFQLNTENQLVTSDGSTVSGGGPIVIPPGTAMSDIVIGPDGTVRAGDAEVGRIELVRFADNGTLYQTRSSLFAASEGAATEPSDAILVQGSIEGSNASAVSELVSMITGMRHFGAAQQAMRAISEVIEQHTSPNQ